MMKFLVSTVCLIYFLPNLLAQRISKIEISGNGTTQSFTINVENNTVINISPEGNIINYGIEYFSDRVSNYSRLENYNGRIDMFGPNDDKVFQGKLKYLGRTAITYYASYEDEYLRGKVKSIGSLSISYNMPYSDTLLRGKIKSIGQNEIGFYTSFDNAGLRGKLKQVGITNLNYYPSFEDKAFRGKIKSIGQTSFTYYASYEQQYAGSLKTGNYTLNTSGITFNIR